MQIQISDPNPENPEKSTVQVRGRDLTAMKEVEIVMKETVLPRDYQRTHRYDEDTLIENGIYENVEKELEDLQKAGALLAQGFDWGSNLFLIQSNFKVSEFFFEKPSVWNFQNKKKIFF